MKLPSSSVRRVVAELRDAGLGDPRRQRRLDKVAARLAHHPGGTLPEIMGDDAELEGAYRLMNNAHVGLDKLVAAHAKRTRQRARHESTVLVLHDTTPCPCPHAAGEDVGFLNTGKPGFYFHYSLVVAEGSRRPLGVVHAESVSRPTAPGAAKGKKTRRSGAATHKDPDREFLRWERGIQAAAQGLKGCTVIHVGDRETDAYSLVAECVAAKHRFVFRARILERVVTNADGDRGALKDLMADQEGVLTREVALTSRRPRSAPAAAKAHPPRHARVATLHFSAAAMELQRPSYLGDELPPRVTVNVVRVWEPDPPAGEEAVEWVLFTTEPVDSAKAIAKVVDIYRSRWLIEEFNKALKDGCLADEREFESSHAMLTFLAMCLPIACEILALRAAVRENPDAPATTVLSALQIRILRHVSRRPLSAKPTVREALLAIAALGGHLKSNGEPGPLVLQRGMRKLQDYEVGWAAREEAGKL